MPDGSATGQESIFFRRINAGSPLEAASLGHNDAAATLTSGQVDSLLPEAIHRWQLAGIDTSALAGLDIRIADLSGATLGLAYGHTIWLDASADGIQSITTSAPPPAITCGGATSGPPGLMVTSRSASL